MTSDKVQNTACFLFDLDGTVYLGDQLLPGAAELLAFLDRKETPYFFLTNNSSRSRADYTGKLSGYGLEVPEEKVFSSGVATAIYLNKNKPGARIYLVGTPSLEEEFRTFGFKLVEEDPDYHRLASDAAHPHNDSNTYIFNSVPQNFQQFPQILADQIRQPGRSRNIFPPGFPA